MGPSNLVKAAIFSAVAIGMGFSLMLIPNIELITVVVFLSGLYPVSYTHLTLPTKA